MKKTLILGAVLSLLFVNCSQEKDPFTIGSGVLGKLTKETQIRQVDSIFAQDSIHKLSTIENLLGTQGEVEVFEKGGNKLLLLSPENESDPNSRISNIQIFDPRFKTDKGLHLGSTFGDVKANYEVDNVQTTISAVVVFLKNSDIYVTIDKKQLPENVRYNLNAKVEATQIPDAATFKYFMVGWEAPDTANED